MRFGIRYPDGNIAIFPDEAMARQEIDYQQSELGRTSVMHHLYKGGVLVAQADDEDEWLEVTP